MKTANANCAFHGNAAVKEKYVNRLREHRRLENLIQGVGWNGAKGCAVGCTLERYDHRQYPEELGLPVWLAYFEDRIFEALPKAEAEQFAEDFLAVIPVGADVTSVSDRLSALRMERLLELLKENKEPYAEQCRAAIIGVRNLCLRRVNNAESWSEERAAAESARAEAEAAGKAAWAAAWAAPEEERAAALSASAADEAAWAAVESASGVEAWAAENAARAAARTASAASRSAAWAAKEAAGGSWDEGNAAQDHWRWEARTLLRLLSECPGAALEE